MRPAPGGLHALGNYASFFALLPRPAGDARSLLPRGLGLAPQELTPEGEHPVVLMLGRHTHVRPSVLPVRGASYFELLTAVPFVTREGVPSPLVYMPRLYLNSWLFVVLGWLYGYPKRRARIRADAKDYAVRTLLGGSPLVHGRFEPRGPAGPLSDYPWFERVRPVFEQPFVGKIPFGPFLCSIMRFDLARAVLTPVDAVLRIERPFLRGLLTGEHRLGGIDQGWRGAFHIEMPWTLSLPMFCGRMARGEGSPPRRSEP
jgi:hypothetical protein